jgi:7-carboxy-7-deazaguanine synthase
MKPNTTEPIFKVNEQFDSVQGEGLLIGRPSTFIRLQGCSVGCPWCDSGPLADELEGKRRTNGMTANTWGPGGEWKTLHDIMDAVRYNHVIITGGEPTIWNLDPILQACKDASFTTQLETSGQNKLKGMLIPDWITWSPKKNLDFEAPYELKYWVSEIKYVIDDVIRPEDIQKAVDYYTYELPVSTLREFVLMPEGCPPSKVNIDKAIYFMDSGAVNYRSFPVRLGWRLQYSLNMR